MVQEVELKLIVSPKDISLLKTHAFLNQQPEYAAQHILSNQYFDTPDQQLTQAGIALRIRNVQNRWIQTLKGKGTNVAGLHQRLELEWELERPELDLSLIPADLLPADLEVDQVQPLFVTDFERSQFLYSAEDGSDIEIVIDQGEARAGGLEDPICELELELKSGVASALFETALTLARTYPLVPSDVSKAERGYRLVNNEYNALAKSPSIKPEQSIGDAFELVMAYEFECLQRQWEAFHFSQNWTHLYGFRNTLGNIKTNFLLFRDILTSECTQEASQAIDWLESKLHPLLSWWPACYILSQQVSDEPRSASEQLQQAKARQALSQLNELERTPEFGYQMLTLSRWLHQGKWRADSSSTQFKHADEPIGKAMLEPIREQWLSLHLGDCGGNASSWLQHQTMIRGLSHICQTLEHIAGSEMKLMRQELEQLENNLVELSAMDVVAKLGSWIQELTQTEKQSINSWTRGQTVLMREMNLHAQRLLGSLTHQAQ